jgi:hypothetical protein
VRLEICQRTYGHMLHENEPNLDAIIACLEHEGINIRHEVAHAVTNMLTLCQIHPHII